LSFEKEVVPFLKYILSVLILLSLKSQSAFAQKEMSTGNRADTSHFESQFGLGFYAGANCPLSPIVNISDLGPSFMIYGRYNMSVLWQVEIGFGGVFYYGKFANYLDSKSIFDTVYAKSYTITGLAYTMVPVIFKYQLSNKIKILAGLRWMGISGVYGNGSYGIYSPANNDSFIFKYKLIPNLPQGANFMDIQGLAGTELSFSRHFSASLIINFGFISIFPATLGNVSNPVIGNYNNSIELGLNYVFTPLHVR